jgi:Fe-S-cluster containining protein
MNVGPARCDRCEAVCCRLTVVLTERDDVPASLTTVGAAGERIMARGEGGWCAALGPAHRCSIYAARPQACRNFAMAGPYCRAIRIDHADRRARGIALVVY